MGKSILLERGTFSLGHTTHGKDGNIVESVPPHWDAEEDGPSIAIVPVDTNTREQNGEAYIVAARDLNRIAEEIKGNLGLDAALVPDLKGIATKLKDECGLCLCDYCPERYEQCDVCPLAEEKF